MLRSGRMWLMSTKRSKITVSPSSINNRRRVLTGSNGSIRIFKCYLKTKRNQSNPRNQNQNQNPHFDKKKGKEKGTYKAITLGSASVFVSNYNSFQDFTKLFKIPSHGMSLSLPSQTSNKNFGESGIIVLTSKAKAAAIIAAVNVMKLPLLRHKGKTKIEREPQKKKYASPQKAQN